MTIQRRFWGMILLGCAVFLTLPSPANAYEGGMHFYLTYVMAYWCGLDSFPSQYGQERPASQVDDIAWADYSVDYFPGTDPGSNPGEWLDPTKVGSRRLFHFPVPAGSDAGVVRGSPTAWQTVDAAIEEGAADAQNPILLGIGIHTLQDSYSHEGFGPRLGHWRIAPDLPITDEPKALEMAEATWFALDRWSKKVHGIGCAMPFTDVSGLIETWLDASIESEAGIMNYWQTAVEEVVHRTAPPDLFNGVVRSTEDFIAAAAHVRQLKGGASEDQKAVLQNYSEQEAPDGSRQ
jgi:hypothetical protein